MAPEADILAANSIGSGVAASNAVIDAIAWMKAKAQAAGKPLVVNLSLGSYFGARDGTSNFEQALSNAGAAGVILVAAVGNEGSDPIRAIGTISQDQTVSVPFRWAESVTGEQKIEMWYPGANRYAVRMTGPNGCATDFVVAGGSHAFTTPCGVIDVSSTGQQVNNDDRQILVSIARGSGNPTGAWTIEVRGDTVAAARTPFSMICGEDGSGLLFTANTESVTRSILTDTSSATRTIGVASYNTNYSWQTTNGAANVPTNHGAVGDISIFSSRGPRRDCSNAAKCPPAMKPEITAPGAMIMAAYGQDAKAVNDDTLEADGKHVAYNGTSMATPHVSGAVALLLQKNASLTPEDVKRLLGKNPQTNPFTAASGLATFSDASPLMPPNPNYTFGYGILDAQAAAKAVSTSAGSGLAATDNVTGLWWNAAESGWGINLNHQGTTLFATLFSYDAGAGTANRPLWVVLPSGAQQSDGSFQGAIYQTTGPAFDANPFTPIGGSNVVQAGTMTLAFASKSQATLQYTVNGASVTKQITPQAFGTLQACHNVAAAAGGRAARTNYTDLWWNAAESGWGLNVTHQDNTLFAALFTYEAGGGTSNRGTWFVMSAGTKQPDGSYSGDLYQTTGPAFNANPFTPIGAANLSKVGTMGLRFADGEHGTLTYTVNGQGVQKAIVPQTFGTQLPSCS